LLLRAERARAEAEAANRIKDEFLATLSHELRTPLTSLLGWSSVLREAKRDEKVLSQGLDAIDRNARVQAQLIDDLLDVSRIVSGKLNLDVRPLDICLSGASGDQRGATGG
jgi:signal transduction histidine kinase